MGDFLPSGNGRIGVVDIGSNSVRLVAYERLSRALLPLYNDKVMCGLGNGVQTTGRLPAEGLQQALAALRRFRILADMMQLQSVRVIATAAARDAANGAEFLAAARETIGVPIELLSGPREAQLAAFGVVSSIHKPDGVVGDLGGGSLEFNDVKNYEIGTGVSVPLGGLALRDTSGKSLKKAVKIARDTLAEVAILDRLHGRTFYAVGGTWRSVARLHMRMRDYPLNVMHNYVIPARDAADFASYVEHADADTLIAGESVSAIRRPLLAYGAIVLEEIIRRARPREVVVAAHGVREGLLYEALAPEQRAHDPLIEAAQNINRLRSRAPAHADDLVAWTGALLRSAHLPETDADQRLRWAACLLFDVSWRAHPDYRGEQAIHEISNADFTALTHGERAFLALTASYRHLGPGQDESSRLRTLVSARMLDRSHVLGAAMRVAYVVAAAMPGVLPRVPLVLQRNKLVLTVPPDLAGLAGERVAGRLKHLGRLLGREVEIRLS